MMPLCPATAQAGATHGPQTELSDSHGRSARRCGPPRLWQPRGEDTAPRRAGGAQRRLSVRVLQQPALRVAGYRTVLSGKMHFCGPDQLHGFEERLTTDIYPADFGWTPDWANFADRPSWYHNMDSVTRAGVCTRTNQIDFDDEVVFQAKR